MQQHVASSAAPIWGGVATVLWGLAIVPLFLAVQISASLLYVMAELGPNAFHASPQAALELMASGDSLSFSIFAAVAVTLIATAAAVRLKRGARLRDYLGLVAPDRRQFLRWIIIAGAFMVASDMLTMLLGRPVVPEPMAEFYASAAWPAVFVAALVIAAPLGEEILFRGFLLPGLAASRLGAAGAIMATAAVWTIIHVQYDAYGLATIFVIGLLLGAARALTGSTVLTILLHMLINAAASLQMVLA